MFYHTHEISEIHDDYIKVDAEPNLKIWLPSILPRRPELGDIVAYMMDDVDEENAIFVRFMEDATVYNAETLHKHQLLTDEKINQMPIDDATKAELRKQTTGGVIE